MRFCKWGRGGGILGLGFKVGVVFGGDSIFLGWVYWLGWSNGFVVGVFSSESRCFILVKYGSVTST